MRGRHGSTSRRRVGPSCDGLPAMGMRGVDFWGSDQLLIVIIVVPYGAFFCYTGIALQKPLL